MRTERGTKQIMSVRHVGDPIAHGFTNGVFQRAAAVGDTHHLGTQQPHTKDIQTLAAHVFFTHVYGAIEAEESTDSRGGNPMLTGTGFRNNAALAHTPG